MEVLATAWDGFDSDTREALRGVSAETRRSFYRPSSLRKLLGVMAVVLSLALILTGLAMEKPLGYAFMLGGVLGLEVVAISFSYRS